MSGRPSLRRNFLKRAYRPPVIVLHTTAVGNEQVLE